MRPKFKSQLPLVVFGALAVLSWAPTVAGAPETKSSEAQEGWKGSPFLAERSVPKPMGTVEAGSGEEFFVLKGILWDPKSPSAIVNDRVVSTGGRLGRWRVVEIQKDRVILSDGSSTREISAQ